MNKQQAAQFLGVSIRAIERYTNKGRLSVHYSRGKRGNVAVYDKGELQAMKAEMDQALAMHKPAMARETPTPPASPVKADTPDTALSGLSEFSSRIAPAIAQAVTQAMAASLSDLSENIGSKLDRLTAALEATRANGGPAVPLAERLTLSLSEAAALSGLPADALSKAIRKSKLKAIKTASELRIKRNDLEKYIHKL